MRKETLKELKTRLQKRLSEHQGRIESDPQSNPVKLLAYDISKDVEDRTIAFRDIEALVKSISDDGAISRARRLHDRANVQPIKVMDKSIAKLAKLETKKGFKSFKAWAENAGQAIVFTAHPTFSLSRDIRVCLGTIASNDEGSYIDQIKALKKLPYLPKRAPTLQEEHADTQEAIKRVQSALDDVNRKILDEARKAFPDSWTKLNPSLVNVYSWVGYDIDGRTDITWGDALRLRLQEKSEQLGRYLEAANVISVKSGSNKNCKVMIGRLISQINDALISAKNDLTLFQKDMTNTDNLVAAANNLTRETPRRFLNLKSSIRLINKALKADPSDNIKRELVCLRSQMQTFGLGTARIHFRLNTRHVVSALKAVFGMDEKNTDNRTLLLRASKLTKNVKRQPVNFASLALEKSTAHRQMILTAQIHKYIDDETPIRFLIAECEDSLIPLGMLYLARLYGLENHMDISPLFETADALNNGGRIIDKMLSNPVYRDYIQARGVFAIQTGFSDAGRFMGQIPATLAIERLHSHFASAMANHKVKNVTSVVFNTHGEGLGRGGHPGTIKDRMDYVMSPWAMHQFDKRKLPLCHETSFQGGDGFLWFQTDRLAKATVNSLIDSRYEDKTKSEHDPFYSENDFSWDIFRTIGSEQDSLYSDPNYVTILGGFGQNLLIPTGSRAAKRKKSAPGAEMFNPRQLRAIPHNAILQQFGTPANIFYGVGRAASIDSEKFIALYKKSLRSQSVFSLVITAMHRSNLSILTAYGRLFDPAFWVGRAFSGNEKRLSASSLKIAETLTSLNWSPQINGLATRLRMDVFDSVKSLQLCGSEIGEDFTFEDDNDLVILHALRLAVIMKMLIIATELPMVGGDGTSQLNVLQKLQNFQIDTIIGDLGAYYPDEQNNLEWTKQILEKNHTPHGSYGGYPHINETIIKPLMRGSELVRQITIAITHRYDAFG